MLLKHAAHQANRGPGKVQPSRHCGGEGGQGRRAFLESRGHFFIGGMVEERIMADLRRSYDVGATFTNDFRSVPFLSGALNIGELAFSVPRLVACVTALVLTGAAQFFLSRTRWGKALRATAQSADVALACGIDIDRARMIAFGIATALAGAAGTLTSFLYTVYPEMGKTFMLKAFAVIVLGGMGSFPGAFLGALVLGVVESTASYVTTTQIAEAVIYITLLAMLLLRPQGFFGVKEA